MEIIKNLKWRYATKAFDPNKKLDEANLQKILEAGNLAPSSFGLEPWKFFVIQNPELRKKLKEKAWNQNQITDSSALIVLAVKKTMTESDVDEFINRTANARGLKSTDLSAYNQMIKGFLAPQTKEAILTWNSRQVYVALGFMLETAALLDIDACPMEGFDSDAFDEILNLKNTDYHSLVLCAVGYRGEDPYGKLAKVRKPLADVVVRL